MDFRVLPNEGWDPRIVAVSLGDLVTTFLVVTRRFVVVVDTMINPNTGRQLLDLARDAAPGRQMLVVNTHADWDHYWGNQVFAEVPIFGHPLAASRAVAPEELARKAVAEPSLYAEVELTPPNVLTSRCDIEGGDLTVCLVPTPGHQPDHLAVWIPEIAHLLAGDAAELPFPLVSCPGGLPALRESLGLMLALQPRWVLCCHAPPRGGPDVLQANVDYFDEMERRCAAAAPGASPETIFPLEVQPGWADFYPGAHRDAVLEMLSFLGKGTQR